MMTVWTTTRVEVARMANTTFDDLAVMKSFSAIFSMFFIQSTSICMFDSKWFQEHAGTLVGDLGYPFFSAFEVKLILHSFLGGFLQPI
ncbi:hypothetical protein VNO77_37325 [Canavalia gladiata]|uniref:Uncharacterized protein n=1 Tax=Canavalia gladiata TaxID=3824 RepID=A0AAN9PWN8_CANGL